MMPRKLPFIFYLLPILLVAYSVLSFRASSREFINYAGTVCPRPESIIDFDQPIIGFPQMLVFNPIFYFVLLTSILSFVVFRKNSGAAWALFVSGVLVVLFFSLGAYYRLYFERGYDFIVNCGIDDPHFPPTFIK